MDLVEETCHGVSCFSDCIASGGSSPQIGYADGERDLTWSFEELLARANDSPETAASLVASDIAREVFGQRQKPTKGKRA